MKNKELWQLANRTCAELWITGGIIITVFSIELPFISCLFLNETAGLCVSVFTLIAQVVAFILSIVKVENKLKLYDEENSK
ncbi:MAG: SdpI family protein [Ruminococcus sp.]|nr:SdpI family protein [Ruminococcus sp.]